MKVAREQLYNEIWAEPMTTVAKKYDVSSNYLARICERLSIPRPGRGYWQQRAVGADVEPEPLPDVEPGDEIEWSRDGSPAATSPMSSMSPRKWASDAKRPARHPLLDGARGHFDEVRAGGEKLYVVPRKRSLVDVFVTPGTLERALKLASDLFLFLKARGQRVMLAPHGRGYHRAEPSMREGATPSQYDYGSYDRGHWQPATPTVTLVNDVVIGLTLFETMEEADGVYRDGKYVRYAPPKEVLNLKSRRILAPRHEPYVSKYWFPTGRLAIHAYAAERVSWERTWTEKAPGDLATMFDAIATTLEQARPAIKKLQEQRERESEIERKKWDEQSKMWQREAQEQRQKAADATREKQLLETMAAWRLARDIRTYVAETKQMIEEAGCTINKGTEFDQSLEEALAYASKIDPLRSLRGKLQRIVAEHELQESTEAAKQRRDGANTPDTPPSEPDIRCAPQGRTCEK